MDQLLGSRRKRPWLQYSLALALIAVIAVHCAKQIHAEPTRAPADAAVTQPATAPVEATTQATTQPTTSPATQPAPAAVSIKVDKVSMSALRSANVYITIKTQVKDIRRIEMDLRFDPNVIQPDELSGLRKRDTDSGGSFEGDANEPGLWRLTYVRTRPVESNIIELKAKFEVPARVWSPFGQAKTAIATANVRVFDGGTPAQQLTTTVDDGSVTVSFPLDISILVAIVLALIVFAIVRAPALKRFVAQDKTFSCGPLIYSPRGLLAMFAWLLWGDFCFNLMETVVPSILPLKLRSLESSNTLISLLMTSLPAVFNTFITPGISMWSDRVRTRWGRRLPFIIATLPFLTISLLLIAFSDTLAEWVSAAFMGNTDLDQAKATIILLAIFAGVFDLFNMFVNTVYWYLFNDMVPEELMGQFMSWFRLVATIAGMLYNLLVFQFSLSHMREIYIGAAVLYFVGFGLMCMRIKERPYPPIEDHEKRPNFLAELWTNTTIFFKSSFTVPLYRYWIVEGSVACLAAFGPFYVFLNLSMGLNLGNIGLLGAIGQFFMVVCYMFIGKYVDRWSPVRVQVYLAASGAFFCAGGWIWLCINKPDPVMYVWLAGISSALFAPLGRTFGDVSGLPRLFKLLPREKFGQYNGSMCFIRALVIFAAGPICGWYLDGLKAIIPAHGTDTNYVYRYMFLFSAVTTIISFYCHYKVYRCWKRLGGDASYVPPIEPFRYRDLLPHPDDKGDVHWALIWIVGVGFIGGILGTIAWVLFYTYWQPDSWNAWIFAIAGMISIVLFAAYVRFIKFMERP